MSCQSSIARPNQDALLHVLQRCDWQLFCTLTFRGIAPNVGPAKAAFFAWLRTIARDSREPVDWREISAVLRYEYGGLGGRPHLHALFTGLPSSWVTRGGRMRLVQGWSGLRIDKDFFPTGKVSFERTKFELGYGFAEVQPFDAQLPGVKYIFKPQMAYEFSRFSDRAQSLEFRSIFFTEALTRRLAKMPPTELAVSQGDDS